MSQRIAVFSGNEPRGYFTLADAQLVGEAGTSPGLFAEYGEGEWTSLYRLTSGDFVFLTRTYDEFQGEHRSAAQLIDGAGALLWMSENNIEPPAELFAAAGLIDFGARKESEGPPQQPTPSRPRNNAAALRIVDQVKRLINRRATESTATQPANVKLNESELPDGPFAPRGFRWRGREVVKVFTSATWALLACLWDAERHQPRDRVSVSEAYNSCRKQRPNRRYQTGNERRNLSEMIRKLNDALNEAAIPLEVEFVERGSDDLALKPRPEVPVTKAS